MVTGSWEPDCGFKCRQQWRVIAEALSGEMVLSREMALSVALVCPEPFMLDEAEQHRGTCVFLIHKLVAAVLLCTLL